MTTKVQVEVPAGANWHAVVVIEDRDYRTGDWGVTEVRIVSPGTSVDLHITDSRRVQVRERGHG